MVRSTSAVLALDDQNKLLAEIKAAVIRFQSEPTISLSQGLLAGLRKLEPLIVGWPNRLLVSIFVKNVQHFLSCLGVKGWVLGQLPNSANLFNANRHC